jgi:putative Ca2+/H+ antiporter (TMEM165/GDT1 family)
MNNDKYGFWFVLLFVFLAEIPCILRTMAIQLGNDSIWSVVWGTMTGNILALIVGVLVAKLVTKFLPPQALHTLESLSAVALIVLGLYLLFKPHDHNHHHHERCEKGTPHVH